MCRLAGRARMTPRGAPLAPPWPTHAREKRAANVTWHLQPAPSSGILESIEDPRGDERDRQERRADPPGDPGRGLAYGSLFSILLWMILIILATLALR
jgi:hypothetical protein